VGVRVTVLGGGRSSEHDVSLTSSASVAVGLRQAGHDVREVQIGRDGVWRARDGGDLSVVPGRGLDGADVVFPALHGPFGEDGTVQGLLECLDVPYVGAGVLASALCMDKVIFKQLMAQAGLPQVDFRAARLDEYETDPATCRHSIEELGFPFWIKPARLGSSVGIVRVERAEQTDAALRSAFAYDGLVIAEANAPGLEVECSVLGNDAPIASEPGEIVLTGGEGGWYDYEAKYTAGGMRLQVPARIPSGCRERVRELAVEVFLRAGCSGLARVDFFVDVGPATVLVNELNTIPGFTPTSVYGALFAASGIEYPELLDRLVRLALERHERERAHSF
jgi:D-alanine-D-alanine ligase